MVLGTHSIQHSVRDIATGMEGYHGVPHNHFSIYVSFPFRLLALYSLQTSACLFPLISSRKRNHMFNHLLT